MATIRLLPTAYSVSNTSYVTVTNPENMYTNIDSSSTCTIKHNRTSTTAYYCYLKGFDWTEYDNLPSGSTITSVTIKIRGYKTGGSNTTLAIYNDTTSISNMSGYFNSTDTTVTYNATSNIATLRTYGANLGIRIPVTRSSRNTATYTYVNGAEILIEYEPPAVTKEKYDITTTLSQENGATGSIDPLGTTQVEEDDSFTLLIYPGSPDYLVTVSDNGSDKSSSLVEKELASGGSASSNITSYNASGSLSTATAFSNANGKGYDASTTTSNGYCSTSGSTVTVTYGFDFSSVPSNAEITSVRCRVSGHAESSSNSNEHCDCQVYKGSAAAGTQKSFKSTGTTNTVLDLNDLGSWTRAELDTLTLHVIVGYYGGAINGATVDVEYTVPGEEASVYYEYTLTTIQAAHTIAVTIKLDSSEPSPLTITPTLELINGATGTIDPSSAQTVRYEHDYSIKIYPGQPNYTVTITDNGVSKTSSLIKTENELPTSGVLSSVIQAYTKTGTFQNEDALSGAVGNGYDTTNQSTANAYCQTQNSTATYNYTFDFSNLPANATITSVRCRVSGHCENASQAQEHMEIQLYCGDTARGSELSFKDTGTTNTVLDLNDSGTWTKAELNDLKLVVTVGYYGGGINGATVDVTYSLPGGLETYYTYDLTDVTEDHTLNIKISASKDVIYLKISGAWKKTVKVYKKVNGSWIEQYDLTTVFQQGTNYTKGD